MKILMYTEIDITIERFHIKFIRVCYNFINFLNCLKFRLSIVSLINMGISVFFLRRCDPARVMASSFLRFLDYT